MTVISNTVIRTTPRRDALTLALHSLTLIAFMAASSVPTPLYRLYQHEWGFSATLLTVIFAAYAFALLCALLIAGRLSDHVGRRPVIAVALLLNIAAMLCFLFASHPYGLVAARIVQGFATGLATAAVGAALLDVHPERGSLVNSIAPLTGMAAGAMLSCALLAYQLAPLHSGYLLLICVFVLLLAGLACTPETGLRRIGAWASLQPSVAVPPQARTAFWRVMPGNVAVWMVGGFYLSLMPSLLAQNTPTVSRWLSGISVAALTLSGAVAILLARRTAATPTLRAGALCLIVGMTLMLFAVHLASTGWLLAGACITGLGFGMAFLGALRSVLPLAKPHERAGLTAVFYIESYLANSVPVIIAGYLTQHLGLIDTTYVYGSVILTLATLAIVLTFIPRLTKVK
ncbi:MFS transporter [Symbiopectobacterium purcellii]|uniref:MFS transporter n=1 Tax=Symbiopectobacterium purcellii TaxID=2871826 RepID=UPI003F86F813